MYDLFSIIFFLPGLQDWKRGSIVFFYLIELHQISATSKAWTPEESTAVQLQSPVNAGGTDTHTKREKGHLNLCVREFHEFFQKKCCSETHVCLVLHACGVYFRVVLFLV